MTAAISTDGISVADPMILQILDKQLDLVIAFFKLWPARAGVGISCTAAWGHCARGGGAFVGDGRHLGSARAAPVAGYDAFISYSHAADGTTAPVFQRELERIAKPWYRMRSMRVFLDEASLSANPGLWPSIENALSRSGWLILMASPEAASSDGVNREATWWLEHAPDPMRHLVILLTAGDLAWDKQRRRFTSLASPVLPPALRVAFAEEPHWVDLRWLHGAVELDRSDTRLRDCAGEVAAAIWDKDKDLIIGEHIRQHRRALRLARGGITALAVLLVIAIAAGAIAWVQRDTAISNLRVATARQLAMRSESLDAANPVTAAALASAAWRLDPGAEARTSLLDVLAQPARAVIKAARGNISAMAFSPDGKLFATATDTGAAQIWDTATHREVGRPLELHEWSNLDSIWFGRDDIATTVGGQGGPSQFWNITARRAIGEAFQIPDVPFTSYISSSDGKTIAAAGDNGALGIIDVATRHQVGAVLMANPLAFSRDGRLLAITGTSSSHAERTVRLLDLATRQLTTVPTLAGSAQYLPAAAFSPDGKLLAITGQDSVSIWDIAGRHTVGPPLEVDADEVTFSPDGSMIATVSPDGTTDLWDAGSHQQLGGPLTLDAGTNDPVLAFSPGSSMLATSSASTVTFWDVSIFRQVGATITGGSAPVAFSPDGKLLAATTLHGAGFWHVKGRQQAGRPIVTGPIDGAMDIAFSPDGKTLATGSYIGVPAQLWSVTTYRRTGVQEFAGHGDINAVAFSPDGKLLATSNNQTVWIWDVRTGRVVGRSMTNSGSINTVAFSPKGTILALTGDGIRLYNVATHHQVGRPLAASEGQINDLAFSPDGTTVATASDNGVDLWNVASQQELGTPLITGAGPVEAVTFSPDGSILATASQDGTVRLWDVASREQIGAPLASGRDPVYSVAFSPDGTLLAAATGSTTRIWGVAMTRDVLNRVCAIADGSMTAAEWNFYVSTEPFQQICR